MIYKKKYVTSILLASVLALTSCNNAAAPSITQPPEPSSQISPTPGNEPPTPDVSESLTPSPAIEEVTPEPTTEIPAATEIPMPSIIPEPNNSCMYINYSNTFPVIVTDTCEVVFHDDDLVSIFRTNGNSGNYRLSELISIDGKDTTDSDSWYFCGALQFGDTIYAHYDYLNNEPTTPSILVRINTVDGTVSPCIVSNNPKKHFGDSFVLVNGRIYYTNTTYTSNTETTNILSADLDGQNTAALFTGTSDEQIPYLTTDGNFLYFVLRDNRSVNQLYALNPLSDEPILISKHLGEVDFLVTANGYILTSTQNNLLTYYNITNKTAHTITLSTESGLTSGHPVSDGTTVYIPAIYYDKDAPTKLIPVDFATNTALPPITLNNEYYHIIGMIDQYVYAENMDEFIIFDITKNDGEIIHQP